MATPSDIYAKSLDEALASALGAVQSEAANPSWFERLLRRLRGAYPTVVLQALEQLGQGARATAMSAHAGIGRDPAPELHPLDYEWYFTAETAREMAKEIAGRSPILCIGTPTLADSLASLGTSVTLLDRSPHIPARFPALATAGRFLRCDVTRAVRFAGPHVQIVFDAPWYQGDILWWLRVASQWARPRSTITFALFPELVRPSALDERDQILEMAEELGRVEVHRDTLSYATPLFERRALEAAGIPSAGDWRRGDLVRLHVRRTPSARLAQLRAPTEQPWHTFLVGRQAVKLRPAIVGGPPPVTPVEGTVGTVLPATSRRDNRRFGVNFWTSRNHVLQVSKPGLVYRLLSLLHGGMPFGHAWQLLHPPDADGAEALSARALFAEALEISPEDR